MTKEKREIKLDLTENMERFSGFADVYNDNRPKPPKILSQIALASIARIPNMLVDIGCGTGLSTRYWIGKIPHIIGVDPNIEMLNVATKKNRHPTIEYKCSFSDKINLPGNCADIVTCANSLHWMEPESTFQEVCRILKNGGIFVAYDNYYPPTIGSWQVEAAYRQCIDNAVRLEKEEGLSTVNQWQKGEHLNRMKNSGYFKHVKEVLVHNSDKGNVDRLIGVLFSQGVISTMLKKGYTMAELGVDDFIKIATKKKNSILSKWYWSCRIRIGIL